jgi:hypothetical protein
MRPPASVVSVATAAATCAEGLARASIRRATRRRSAAMRSVAVMVCGPPAPLVPAAARLEVSSAMLAKYLVRPRRDVSFLKASSRRCSIVLRPLAFWAVESASAVARPPGSEPCPRIATRCPAAVLPRPSACAPPRPGGVARPRIGSLSSSRSGVSKPSPGARASSLPSSMQTPCPMTPWLGRYSHAGGPCQGSCAALQCRPLPCRRGSRPWSPSPGPRCTPSTLPGRARRGGPCCSASRGRGGAASAIPAPDKTPSSIPKSLLVMSMEVLPSCGKCKSCPESASSLPPRKLGAPRCCRRPL